MLGTPTSSRVDALTGLSGKFVVRFSSLHGTTSKARRQAEYGEPIRQAGRECSILKRLAFFGCVSLF